MTERKPDLYPQQLEPNCVSTTEQNAEVNVSVRLKPFVTVNAIETECCGLPEVRHCFRRGSCYDHGFCDLYITQSVLVKLALEYGATAQTGEAVMDCRVCPLTSQVDPSEEADCC